MEILTSTYNKTKRIKGDGFVFISITRGPVPAWYPHPCVSLKELAPQWEKVDSLKNNRISWDEFKSAYKQYTRIEQYKEPIKQKLEGISKENQGKVPVLLCHCGDYTRCHRSIVGEVLGIRELSDYDLI